MRTLIIGAGRVGQHLIRFLSSAEENRFTVIEKKKDRCKEVANTFDATIIQGDASNPEILKTAEPAKADLLIAATDSDRVNDVVTQAAKKEFAIPRVIAVANSPKSKARLAAAGADVVFCPVELALKDMENIFSDGGSTTLMYRTEIGLKAVEATIPLNASIMGKQIQQLQIPEKCRISLICRNGSYVFPEPAAELRSGDRILLLGDARAVEQTVELLRAKELT